MLQVLVGKETVHSLFPLSGNKMTSVNNHFFDRNSRKFFSMSIKGLGWTCPSWFSDTPCDDPYLYAISMKNLHFMSPVFSASDCLSNTSDIVSKNNFSNFDIFLANSLFLPNKLLSNTISFKISST